MTASGSVASGSAVATTWSITATVLAVRALRLQHRPAVALRGEQERTTLGEDDNNIAFFFS